MGHRSLGFHVSVGPHLAVVLVLADEIGFAKGLFQVSPAGLRLAPDVPIGFVHLGVVGVDFRGIRFHGLFRVKDGGEQLVFHLDERKGLLGRILVYGGHPGQVLPDMTDPYLRQSDTGPPDSGGSLQTRA